MTKTVVHLVEPEERYTVEIDGRDRRAFERAARVDLGPRVGNDLAVFIRSNPETYVLWLSWHAAKRSGLEPPAWDAFESRAVLSENEEGDELVPTVTAATAD